VATPLPPGVTAPPLIDEDALPPGVSAPAEPPAATGDEVTGEREPPPAPAAAAPAEPASPNGAPRFEELDAPAHPALVRAVEDEDVTADHPTVDPDATQAYDPFAATDDELPPWERDDPNKRD
jgi:hypothetical protein